MYGNTEADNEDAFIRFPIILSEKCDYFSIDDCNFGVEKSKLSTARIALWKILNIPAVYTIEASFYGPNIGKLKSKQFEPYDYESMGIKLCETLGDYLNIYVDSNVVADEQSSTLLHSFTEIANKIKNKHSDDQSGSDSDPSEYSISTNNKKSLREISKIAKVLDQKTITLKYLQQSKHQKDGAYVHCTIINQNQQALNTTIKSSQNPKAVKYTTQQCEETKNIKNWKT